MARYAKGTHALGICARSGRQMMLKDMVPDGNYPGLMVDPDWRDIKHPIETPKNFDDAVALRRPAPNNEDASAGAGGTLASLFPDGEPKFGGGT